ncbi:uncharacterized protein K452DRAFT_293973 [Aplosporella prunicola CBS 121167]|uniref:F-box domain-containing protein n=1 Tax=Aplosporella prunicola CBS 121167 TaxID=1176127 RepID=A0A6A6BU97_9PEZI|nr:uncharacterized protein K452DRAFT_293973 [Aplosporella prunicola CBS 121167]KAF2147580.1 hypothetical protein K452DRAFT_293973 [Aplosporella prunicola CBS 121167]
MAMTLPARAGGSSPLETLPTEIVCRITDNLDIEDFQSLRLTCKEVEAKSVYSFGKCFLENVELYFIRDDLRTLVNISRSTKFAGSILVLANIS